MIKMFAHHGVKDFEGWLSAGRAAMNDSERMAQAGILASSVYRTIDGGGGIVVHTFKDKESAQKYAAMMQSAEGQAMLDKIGAILPLTFWLGEEVEL